MINKNKNKKDRQDFAGRRFNGRTFGNRRRNFHWKNPSSFYK